MKTDEQIKIIETNLQEISKKAREYERKQEKIDEILKIAKNVMTK